MWGRTYTPPYIGFCCTRFYGVYIRSTVFVEKTADGLQSQGFFNISIYAWGSVDGLHMYKEAPKSSRSYLLDSAIIVEYIR